MLRALSTAATGMEAQELKLDLIANNLANVNTPGFKKVRGEFQDLLYETLRAAGALTADGTEQPTGIQIGQGVKPVATLRQHTMGTLKQTGNSLDMAIEGSGFFQIEMPDGRLAYTRDGSFKTDSAGRLVSSEGHLMQPQIVFPVDTREILIAADGTVSVLQAEQREPVEVGRIETTLFANPAGLQALGHNLYAPTAASGEAQVGVPGSEGMGSLAQGYLEMSNVKVIEEMIEMIATQRAYETNSRVIKAADDMLRATSNLR